MITASIITLVHFVSFAGVTTMVKRHKPHHFHSQSAFSVLLGIYFIFFTLTAMQTVAQITNFST